MFWYYYKILEILESKLKDYTLTTKENKQIKTGEKRLFAPSVVAVQNGEIKDFHEGTVDSQNSGYDPLKKEEKEELQKKFTELINSISIGVCKEGC